MTNQNKKEWLCPCGNKAEDFDFCSQKCDEEYSVKAPIIQEMKLDEYLKTLKYILENYDKDALDWDSIVRTLKDFANKKNVEKCICKTKVESKCYWHGK